MWREEGLAGLWSGATSSLVLTVNPAIQFMVYEAAKRQAMRVSAGRQLSSSTVFLVGAVAKTVATVLTYPIQLVQAKQRVSMCLCWLYFHGLSPSWFVYFLSIYNLVLIVCLVFIFN